jgi:hypothetical protein
VSKVKLSRRMVAVVLLIWVTVAFQLTTWALTYIPEVYPGKGSVISSLGYGNYPSFSGGSGR